MGSFADSQEPERDGSVRFFIAAQSVDLIILSKVSSLVNVKYHFPFSSNAEIYFQQFSP